MKNSNNKKNQNVDDVQLTSMEVREQIRRKCENIISFCTEGHEDTSFFFFEKQLIPSVYQLGCLFFQLFLIFRHEKMNYGKWTETDQYYTRKKPIGRTIKTVFGKVRYWRTYLVNKDDISHGFHPLDSALGLTRDGFSPFIMSLVTRLATRVSFATCTILFENFYGWSPSTDSIEELVLGIGREAAPYMEVATPPDCDGEVLIIEVDGKATPTATEGELAKRRTKRKNKKTSCCQRHRGKEKRRGHSRRRRKKGDKSKNGRSAALVVMYTLKRGGDGLLHGPINKKVWASYAPRKVMLKWVRRQATKRGFPPDTDKRIHVAVDGEKCLKTGLEDLFETATFALDIRHVEEYLWKAGRAFHKEGSDELYQMVDGWRDLLYQGKSSEIISHFKELDRGLSKRAKRDEKKRETLATVINYMESRTDMMNYDEYIEEDLPVASGIVEGAARYVIGERMDCAGMRWVTGRAEALLQLRCIELNGDWDQFFEWGYERWKGKLAEEKKVIIRTNESMKLPDAA